MSENQHYKRATYHLWTFVISKFLSAFGISVYSFGISLYVLTLTGSAMSFAINLLCSAIPRSILSPFAGHIIDRYSKKMIVILARSLSVIIVIGLLSYSLINELTLLSIYVTTALLTICSMFTGITMTASVANLIDNSRIHRAMALNQTAVSSSTIGGPIVGGILYGFVSMEVFFFIHVIFYLIVILLEASMNFKLYTNRRDAEQQPEKMIRSVIKGMQYIKHHNILLALLLTALVVNFFSAAIVIGSPYVVVDQLKIRPEHFGIIEATFAGGMLLASLYLSIHKEFKYPLISAKRGILILAGLITIFPMPLIFLWSYGFNILFYIFIALSYGMTLTYVNTPIGVMLQKRIDEEYKGRIFGLLESGVTATTPLSMILFGFLFDSVGAIWTIIPSSIGMFIVTLYILRKTTVKKAYPELYKNKKEFSSQIEITKP